MKLRIADRGRHLLVVVMVLVLSSVFLSGETYAQGRDEVEARGLVETVAATMYGIAWPTATYKNFSLESVDSVDGGYDLMVRLEGESGFGGGQLWMELVMEFRSTGLQDFRVSRHNALLAAPFSTSKAIGDALAEIAESAAEEMEDSGSPESGRLYVSNNCRYPIKLAIFYRELDGDWVAESWWNIDGNTSTFLTMNGGKYVRTTSSVMYYYAESQNGDFFWGDSENKYEVGDKTLPMVKVVDKTGDTEWSVSCPDR